MSSISRAQHKHIASAAISRGWLSVSQAMDAMLEIGILRAKGKEAPLDGWVTRGYLSEAQLDSALEQDHVESAVVSLPSIPHAQEPQLGVETSSEEAETWMTLPTTSSATRPWCARAP